MDLIVITSPVMLPGEADILNQLFCLGLTRLHVRKPDIAEKKVEALIEAIEPRFRDRIALHQHHHLAPAYGIKGIHLTQKTRLSLTWDALDTFKKQGFTLSTSLHDPNELRALSNHFDYVLFGPVFNSISKPGHASILPPGFQLNRYGFKGKVIALGGIDSDNIKTIGQLGLNGAALLGSIWQNPQTAPDQYRLFCSITSVPPPAPFIGLATESSGNAQGNFEKSNTSHPSSAVRPGAIDRLQFISQEKKGMSHIESIQWALHAGCRWIQLRVKDRSEADVLAIAWKAIRLCDSFGAKLIVNDYPRVAQAVDAYGLHLGLGDMPVAQARGLVGGKMIIGGTANTWNDIALRIAEGADYIGLGPFGYTETKPNLSPILGCQGYARLMQQMAHHSYNIPIIAIGGITPGDISELGKTGIYGVAMSSALIDATDPKATVSFIQRSLC